MEKYLFKANIFAKLSEIVEADSEKEVWDKIRNRKSFEINQEVLNLYPSSIEIRKVKEKKEKQMTSTELIKNMLERQKAYDAEVSKKHNVDYVSKSQLESALFDELGELMHAQKSDWCWWKKTQPQVDEEKVLGELVDIWHFVLSYTDSISDVRFTHIDWMVGKGINTFEQEGLACLLANIVNAEYENKLFYLIAVSLCLGFTIEDVYQAYCDKNKINYQRLKEGY